ncbi:hypothetical protein [Clostridium gasigenes]|uniref:hypothetical protein n=1 Tax=Clostridium gasigenes TaxID=94869 RepID=UPI001C0DECFB|nr:hypothetical protein [Clostridium gasigenes]MBU3109276.1 hypothetical protein [Clostridium gasigenes]
MKGKIIDLNNSEAFVSLEDDTIITIPLTNFNASISIGSSIDMTSLSGSYGLYNNHRAEIAQNKLIDFF